MNNFIGYIYLRSVDSLRYEIYSSSEEYYYIYKQQRYNIKQEFLKPYLSGNLNLMLSNTYLNIFLSNAENYNDFKDDYAGGFRYIYINNIRIENNNDIEIPELNL